MYKIYFDGVTKIGSYIQNACLVFHEEPTMCGLTIRLKEEGYTMFRLPHMSKLVKNLNHKTRLTKCTSQAGLFC